MDKIIIEVITLIAVVATASLTSGGVVMHFLKKHDRVRELEKKFDRLSEGVQLGLENDIVIFKALRIGHINGESEEQERKLQQYFYDCAMKGLDIKE